MTQRVRHVEEVMGTVFTVDGVFPGGDRAGSLAVVAEACQVLHETDALFSTWQECSPVSRFRRGELAAEALPVEVTEVLHACEAARTISGGWFDPWAAPGGVDPTGYVKGWAGQRVLRALTARGALAALVNAAGDVAGFGRPDPGRPWRLGVTDPFSTHEILGTVLLDDAALAVSGTYERGAHIYSPRGAGKQSHVVSTAVVGPDLGLADALATGLVAGGAAALDCLTEIADYQAMVVFADGHRLQTRQFPLVR